MSAKVGDNEIISKINQSPEAITIQASKVNLTGYVTFTNLSTPGQTVIDGGNLVTGTVTANKLDAADINASKTLTVGAMTDAAAATILNDNIQIGGRNLCIGTAVSKTVTPSSTWFAPPVYQVSAYGGTAIADTANTQYTVSFDYTITGVDKAFNLSISPKTTANTYDGMFVVASIPLGSSSGHAEGTGTITAGARQYAGNSGLLFAGEGGTTDNRNVVLTVSNLKFEIGNKATSWTQAPEDVAADIATAQSAADGANLQEQLIYISKPSGTTTVAANTTWVTDTTGSQNTWTLKRPEYNSSYPVLFVATQRKAVDGTVTCTTPMIDLTTTVIDGGHITTGTIDASVVSVTNLNASNITSGTLSANYISGGIMTVGGLNNVNGYIRILDSTGNYSGGVGSSGITAQGEEPYSGLSHVISNAIFPYGYSLRDQTTQKQLINVDVQIPSATDEYAKYYIQGYDSGTQVSRVEFSAYPYNNGAYLILQGPNGLIRLNSDGTYAGDLTINYGGNLTIKGGVLDVVDRRCYATLSSAGWYRAIRFDALNSYDVVGADGSILDIYISRIYNYETNEAHKISLFRTYNNCKFVSEESVSNTLGIDKIRITYHDGGSDNRYAYIDIHYNLSSMNPVAVHFDVNAARFTNDLNDYTDKWFSESLSSVAASPTGETVLTEYTFAANTNVARTAFTPTFSGTANPTVNNASAYYSIKNGVFYAGGRFNLASFTSGGTTVLFTLPVSLGVADRGAETIGTVFTTTKTLQLRSYGADVYITDAGGNYSGGLLNTGYWSFQIIAPIYN